MADTHEEATVAIGMVVVGAKFMTVEVVTGKVGQALVVLGAMEEVVAGSTGKLYGTDATVAIGIERVDVVAGTVKILGDVYAGVGVGTSSHVS